MCGRHFPKFRYSRCMCLVGMSGGPFKADIWVVVKIMVLFWVPSILGAVNNRDPKRDHNFDNHPYLLGFSFPQRGLHGSSIRTLRYKVPQLLTPAFAPSPPSTNIKHPHPTPNMKYSHNVVYYVGVLNM